MGNLFQPIRSSTQIWVVTRHQYGTSALVSQTSFGGKPVAAFGNVGCFLRLKRILKECKIILLVTLRSVVVAKLRFTLYMHSAFSAGMMLGQMFLD